MSMHVEKGGKVRKATTTTTWVSETGKASSAFGQLETQSVKCKWNAQLCQQQQQQQLLEQLFVHRRGRWAHGNITIMTSYLLSMIQSESKW